MLKSDNTMSLQEEFNSWQTGYTEKVSRWVPHYPMLLDTVTSALPGDFSPRNVLDLGCGTGNGAFLLMERFPEAAFTLLDASDEMIGACKRRFGDRKAMQYIQALFQDAVLPESEFDLVVAVLALHHLPGQDKQSFFRNIFRGLKPGGRFVYADLFADKHAPDYSREVLVPWEVRAKNKGTSSEEWIALMEHHGRFDFPDTYDNTMQWLRQAGFQEAAIYWQDAGWGSIIAGKF